MNTKEECDHLSAKAKEIGTQIHELIESYVKGEEGSVKTKYEEEVNTALKSFLKFRKEHPQIKLKWAELQMSDDYLELNGTLDCIGEEDGEIVIIDWKTGECKKKKSQKYILSIYCRWRHTPFCISFTISVIARKNLKKSS